MTEIDDAINRYMYRGSNFQAVVKLFQKIRRNVLESGEIVPEKQWSLYRGVPASRGQDFIVLDTNGYVNPNSSNLPLIPVRSETEIEILWQELPASVKKTVIDVLRRWNINPGRTEEEHKAALASSNVLTRPVPRIRDVNRALREIGDWQNFIDDNLINYKCAGKDRRIQLIQKAHLIRGFKMQLNPHAILATNPGVGKSEFYTHVGTRLDRVNKRVFLGFAKSPGEIYPGIVSEQELPFTIDQVESQDAEDIFAYLNSATEQGHGTVGVGGTKFEVYCRCPFIFLANIQEYMGGELQSFSKLIDNISFNVPAFLKRIGIILHNNELERIRAQTTDFVPWRRRFSFFRGVEECAIQQLMELYNCNETWNWATKEISDYKNRIFEIVANLSDRKVKTGLEEHAQGAQLRIKGAALNVVVAENLPRILNNSIRKEELYSMAEEEVLPQIVSINVESIHNITETWEENKLRIGRELYETFPNYIKELCSAVDFWRGAYLNQTPSREFPLQNIGRSYICKEGYPSFAHVVNAIRQTKRVISDYNPYFRKYYSFELQRRETGIWVRYI